MTRFAALLACCFSSLIACGQTDPEPKYVPPKDHPIIGTWDAVLIAGSAPDKPTTYNFTAEGKVIVAADGKTIKTGRIQLVDQPLTFPPTTIVVLIFDGNRRIVGSIRSISAKELVFGYEKMKCVFRRE